MTSLPHPFCRTCGSRVNSKKVCQHCGCEPLKGNHYCYDCGTSTVPEAIMCVHCGATFRSAFPAMLALLIGIAVLITFAGVAYFVTTSQNDSTEPLVDSAALNISDSSILNPVKPSKKQESSSTIVNNISLKPPVKNDAISRLAKSVVPPVVKNEPAELPKPIRETKKEITRTEVNTAEPNITSERSRLNGFSSGEAKGYSAFCTYFTGKNKSGIIFLTNSAGGYVKINGKVYGLRGIEKGNDIARFAGADFEVTLEIEGLAGSEKQWLASGNMVIKDVKQRTYSRYKIYSSCLEF